MNRTTIVIVLAALASSASAEEQTISEYHRVTAIWYSYGLGCAVQDRSTERAMAWTQSALGLVTALSKTSPKEATEWAAFFNSAEIAARAKGGFRCEKVTAFPTPPPQELFQS
jgi:hypothetical protein